MTLREFNVYRTELGKDSPLKSPCRAFALAKSSGTMCRTPGNCFTSTVKHILLSPCRQNAKEKNSLFLKEVRKKQVNRKAISLRLNRTLRRTGNMIWHQTDWDAKRVCLSGFLEITQKCCNPYASTCIFRYLVSKLCEDLNVLYIFIYIYILLQIPHIPTKIKKRIWIRILSRLPSRFFFRQQAGF